MDAIFSALSECQALHPDEDDEGEADGEAELYIGDGANGGPSEGDEGEEDDGGMFADADGDDTTLALNDEDGDGDDGMLSGMVQLTPEGLVRHITHPPTSRH